MFFKLYILQLALFSTYFAVARQKASKMTLGSRGCGRFLGQAKSSIQDFASIPLGSFFKHPNSPSQAELSGEQPFLDIERSIPYLLPPIERQSR